MLTKLQGIQIEAIAAAVPKQTLNLESLATQFGQHYVERVQQSTGIQSVRIAEAGMRASDLCAAAAQNIFAQTKVDKNQIDGIIFVSQSPDLIMPATSVLLQHRLGLSTDCVAFDINYGCSGYLYGLFQAALLIQTGACKKVLVCAGDVISPFLKREDSHLRMVLGDAGSATVVTAGTGDMAFALHSDGSGAKHLIIEGKAHETGRVPHLHMDGTEIMNFAMKVVPQVLQEVLEKQGWNFSEVGTFGLHQANRFMLSYLRKKMELPIESVPISVSDVGNTGPASIPLMLSREGANLCREGRLEKVALAGFGVGLSWGAATLSLANTVFLPMLEIETKGAQDAKSA